MSEMVDLTDDAGRVIGRVTRTEMRQNRLPHRCAWILVFSTVGELFCHLRTPSKDVFPSYWDVCVGGVLTAGESFDEGAARELFEEVGIRAVPVPQFPFHFADEYTVVSGYVYTLVCDGPFALQAEEVVRGEFVAEIDLEARFAADRFCPDGLAVWQAYRSATGRK